MLLPFDRERLKQRNALDVADELQASAGQTPSEKLLATIDLSEVVRELAAAAGSQPETSDLELKSHLYVRPLRAATRS